MTSFFLLRLVAAGFLVCLAPAAAFGTPSEDGMNDMSFNLGSWSVHISALHHDAARNEVWNDFDGTAVARKIWNGPAQLEEIEADGSAGHLEALVVFLYNRSSHQWSKAFASSGDGQMGQPMFGEFRAGRGEFYDQELFDGRMALLRAVWSRITPDSSHFEESSSSDGGQTWKPYFIADFKRSANVPGTGDKKRLP